MNRFLWLIIGIFIGMLISAPIVYAATFRILLINSSGQIIGTPTNPLSIQSY